MERKDYVLRLIEQMGAALVALRKRILGREVHGGELDDSLAALADRGGVDLSLLRGFSVDTLHMLVSPGGEVEPGRCWLMAELLYLDGLQAQLEERTEDARTSLTKASVLYALIAPAGGLLVGFPEAEGRREELERRLAELGPGPG